MISTQEAISEARKRGLDLVLIASESKPAVAKILDFNKFLYQENKKKSAAKAKSKKSEIKGIKIGPSTGEGDIKRHLERAFEWIEDGNRVKVVVTMRGRENLYPERAFDKIDKFAEELKEVAKAEDTPKRMGNTVSLIFVAK